MGKHSRKLENAPLGDLRELREEELGAVAGGLTLDLGWVVVNATLYPIEGLCVGWATHNSSGGFCL